ncbi:MAG: cytochrome c oxidase assembly protein [Mycolicibacterium insubricum]
MRRNWWLAAGWAAAGTALAVLTLATGARRFADARLPYPGAVTDLVGTLGFFTATLAGAVTLGALVYVVITAAPDDRGVIDAAAFRVHRLGEIAALVWLLTAVPMIAVQAANNAGASLTELLGGGGLFDAVAVSELARAWIVVAIGAAVVVVTLRLTLRWVPHVVLAIPAAIALVALPVSGNAGQGPGHDYATSSAIVFAVMLAVSAGLRIAAAVGDPAPELHRRIAAVQTAAGAIALLYGLLLAVVLLDGPADLIHTDYGRLLLAAAVVLVAVTGTDVLGWRRGRPVVASRTTALAMLGVLAAVSAMAVQAAPRLLNHRFTVWDIFLGYSLPGPPTLVRILTTWRFDTFLGAAGMVAAAAYLAGYLLLRRRGDTWSTGRLVSWLSGCALLVFDTSSGLRAYGSAMFSVHMAEHMLLNMFVPVLLVLGGPVTLALRTLHPAGHGHPPGPREWLLTLVHSRVTTFLSHPVTAFVLFVASLYIVYFTSLFDHLVRYHWGHELMSTHFLITGYLFFWAIIGIDPGPKRLPFLGRLALLFAVMPFHAFFGIALMTMENIIGGTFYRYLALPWVDSLVDDQHLGGSIAWGSSELPVIIVVIALVAQWAGSDRRAARRSDRHADADYGDDDLDAYNAMLAELSKHRQ